MDFNFFVKVFEKRSFWRMIILAIIFDFIFGDENLVKKLTINEQKVRKTTKIKQNPKVTAYQKARKMQVCACSTAGLVLIRTVN